MAGYTLRSMQINVKAEIALITHPLSLYPLVTKIRKTPGL